MAVIGRASRPTTKRDEPRPRRALPGIIATAVATAALAGAFLNSGCGSDQAASKPAAPTEEISGDADTQRRDSDRDRARRGRDRNRGGTAPPAQTRSAQPPSTQTPPKPVKPAPVKPDPVKPDPVKPVPVEPVPVEPVPGNQGP